VGALNHFSVLATAKLLTPFVAWAGYKIRQHYRQSRAIGWQPTPGTTYKVEVAYKDNLWTATLSYSYSWEGEYYSGFLVKPFAKKSSAEELVSRIPAGSAVTVRVNVDDPQVSALRPEDQFVRF
jgi:hypothetical protein